MLSLTRTWAVMVKEFVQLTRDRLTYAMILLLPIVQLLLFGYAINDDPRNLPTAVLVQDNGAFSRSILTAMTNSGYFDIAVQARSQSELDRALERGEVQFAVVIPADFTRRVVRGDAAQILIEADASDPTAAASALAAAGGLPSYALSHDLKGAAQPSRPAPASAGWPAPPPPPRWPTDRSRPPRPGSAPRRRAPPLW